MKRLLTAATLCALLCSATPPTAGADEVNAGVNLSAEWQSPGIPRIVVNGQALPGVSARLLLIDPRTQKPVDAARFSLEASLSAKDGALWLTGVASAAGMDDAVADLILRIEGATIPTGDIAAEPLLLPKALVNCIPIAPLRTAATGEDRLAIALPPDPPCIHEFRDLPEEKAVQVRFPFGFAKETKPALCMKAPFSIVLYTTEPRWRFRSALAGYYRLFPERFKRYEKRDGGWFFANQTKNIPNPQHFAFHEGSGSVEEDHERDMGMYPYNETSSESIRLKGPDLPKDYDDAMRQMDELNSEIAPADWKLVGGELAADEKRSGQRSFKCTADKADVSVYAQQVVLVSPPIAEPVIVSAWSKAENVKGDGASGYAIYVDALCRDGGPMYGQCAVFRNGAHDWEHAEYVIEPRSPLVELRIHAMFRNHTGTVWFDDIKIARKSRLDENLLKNGDWETLGKRSDIQFVRDNACTDAEGKYRVHITDDFASDVKPTVPLSLLRFACNVDPDLRAPEGRPTPAGRSAELYDTLFKNAPQIDGAYIDSCAAWCASAINHRRDHFACVDSPLTYDPKTYIVGAHGLFAACKWLRFIQDRYHPMGKTIFGNMGPCITAWPCYLALDIIGIESSIFRDTARMAHHRFGAYHKPVLPMNFVNLHGLGDRATAAEFVLASAYWGHFPSTGRMVREGYEGYGDVCHTYYPALQEMAEAGWEPVPMVEGVAAERFGTGDVIYLTIRAAEPGRKDTLTLLTDARQGVKDEPLVMDAVQLAAVPLAVSAKGIEVSLVHGNRELTILRVASRANTVKWLLERAARHCHNAAIVRGRSENTDRLNAVADSLRQLNTAGDPCLGSVLARIDAEKTKIAQEKDSLEKTSILTELLDADRAVAEWLLLTGGARLSIEGERVAPVSQEMKLTPRMDAGTSGARLLGAWAEDGRNILRITNPNMPAQHTAAGQPVIVHRDLPGAMNLRVAMEAPVPGWERPLTVVRVLNLHFTPVVKTSVEPSVDREKGVCTFRVTVDRLAAPAALRIVAPVDRLPIEPAEVNLPADQNTAAFSVPLASVPAEILTLRFAVRSDQGRMLDEARTVLSYVPQPPPGDLALAGLGATVRADSSYPDYTPAPIIDGVWETSELRWQKKAWASRDSALPEGHWVEIALPRPTEISQMWIYWAFSRDQAWCAHDYDVEVWADGAWKPVASVRKGPDRTVSQHRWERVVTDKVRIHQLQGGGPTNRPHIMWVSEVCLFP